MRFYKYQRKELPVKACNKIFKSVLAILLIMLCLVSCTGGLINTEQETKRKQNSIETDLYTDISETSDGAEKNTDKVSAKKKYTVTYKNTLGGRLVGVLEQTVESGGATTSVTAVPDDGYIFQKWSDGLMGATRREIKVTSNKSIFPVFVRIEDMEDNGVPRIFINTDDGGSITSKEIYKACAVTIDNTEYSMSNSAAKIRGRGNSSWNMPKKSYRLKFDKATSMFGSGYEAKDWTLIANYCDKSLSRNAIAHELAYRFEAISFSSMHEFVEVYVNGQYDGVYLVCDQIEVGEGRVAVSEEINTTGDTGYLIEMDARAPESNELGAAGKDVSYFTMSTDSDHYYRLKSPDVEASYYDPDIYLTFIKGYMEECMELIQMYPNEHNDYANTEVAGDIWAAICDKMDVESFAEAYIILELMANLDCHAFSFYFYKQKGGKLYSGPLWDFDISSGNNNYGYGFVDGTITEAVPDLDMQVYGELWVAKQNRWFRRLLRIQEFNDLVQAKLANYEDTINDVISLLDTDVSNTDGYYYKYGDAMESNFIRWPRLGQYDWPNTQTIVNITTVKGQIDYLHEWLIERHDVVRSRFGLF